jgi:hypothetical protein
MNQKEFAEHSAVGQCLDGVVWLLDCRLATATICVPAQLHVLRLVQRPFQEPKLEVPTI